LYGLKRAKREKEGGKKERKKEKENILYVLVSTSQ
jgi:hypothetical protein